MQQTNSNNYRYFSIPFELFLYFISRIRRMSTSIAIFILALFPIRILYYRFSIAFALALPLFGWTLAWTARERARQRKNERRNITREDVERQKQKTGCINIAQKHTFELDNNDLMLASWICIRILPYIANSAAKAVCDNCAWVESPVDDFQNYEKSKAFISLVHNLICNDKHFHYNRPIAWTK